MDRIQIDKISNSSSIKNLFYSYDGEWIVIFKELVTEFVKSSNKERFILDFGINHKTFKFSPDSKKFCFIKEEMACFYYIENLIMYFTEKANKAIITISNDIEIIYQNKVINIYLNGILYNKYTTSSSINIIEVNKDNLIVVCFDANIYYYDLQVNKITYGYALSDNIKSVSFNKDGTHLLIKLNNIYLLSYLENNEVRKIEAQRIEFVGDNIAIYECDEITVINYTTLEQVFNYEFDFALSHKIINKDLNLIIDI